MSEMGWALVFLVVILAFHRGESGRTVLDVLTERSCPAPASAGPTP